MVEKKYLDVMMEEFKKLDEKIENLSKMFGELKQSISQMKTGKIEKNEVGILYKEKIFKKRFDEIMDSNRNLVFKDSRQYRFILRNNDRIIYMDIYFEENFINFLYEKMKLNNNLSEILKDFIMNYETTDVDDLNSYIKFFIDKFENFDHISLNTFRKLVNINNISINGDENNFPLLNNYIIFLIKNL